MNRFLYLFQRRKIIMNGWARKMEKSNIPQSRSWNGFRIIVSIVPLYFLILQGKAQIKAGHRPQTQREKTSGRRSIDQDSRRDVVQIEEMMSHSTLNQPPPINSAKLLALHASHHLAPQHCQHC